MYYGKILSTYEPALSAGCVLWIDDDYNVLIEMWNIEKQSS